MNPLQYPAPHPYLVTGGTLPDPMTGSLTNQSAAAPLNDYVIMITPNRLANPSAPPVPTMPDFNSGTPGSSS